MKRRVWSSLACLVVLWSASGALAQTVKTVRVVLPQQASPVLRNIAGVLARQVAQRCEANVVADGEAPLKVELAIAAGIGTEGFRIEDRPGGGVTIIGNDDRGLLYGLGKLLRTSRYDQGGFTAGAWRGTSIPEKPVRGIYFATHFHNFYHEAPIDEVQRYVEDVGLWGLNTLIVWYDMHHFSGFDSPEAVAFRNRLQAICGAARGVGLDVGFACVANEGYANSPQALRADVKGMRGAAFPTDICTAKAEGRRYVLDNFAQLFDWATDLEPKWVMIWPYDSGGCGCAECQPWGHGGYLRCAEPLANLARSKFPGARVMLSTWFFNGDEWAGLARAFAMRPDWVDYLMVDPTEPPVTVRPSDFQGPELAESDTSDIPPRSGDPDEKPRVVSRESVEYLQRLLKNTPFGTKDFDLAALRAGMGSRREPAIEGVKLIQVKIGDIPCEWVLAPGADPDLRLLYLHGGGFVSGSGGFYLTLAAHLSAAAKCAVLLPDYRLAPEHPFPAGLEDCISAHQWLIASGPAGPAPAKATFIAGDSAGGNLTLATLLALRDRRQPLPAGGIPLSPCTDFTLASESLRTVHDPIISSSTMPVFRDLYLGKTDPRNPLASPVFGDYRGLPPLLIQVGEHEMLRDDSIRVAKKARADGIPVKLEVWPGMFHVFQSHEPLLPEAQEAIEHAADFMRSLVLRR